MYDFFQWQTLLVMTSELPERPRVQNRLNFHYSYVVWSTFFHPGLLYYKILHKRVIIYRFVTVVDNTDI